MNARRRSACRPPGVTTATFTAVSLPAATARIAMPTSAPAPALAPRPRPGRLPRPSRTAGLGEDLRASQAARPAEQPHERAARPGFRASRASSRAGRAPPRSRPPRTCRRRPDELAERRLDGCLGLVGEVALCARSIGPRGDPDVDRLLPRVGRHDRVGRRAAAARPGARRPATRRSPSAGACAPRSRRRPRARPASAAPRRSTSAASLAAAPGG